LATKRSARKTWKEFLITTRRPPTGIENSWVGPPQSMEASEILITLIHFYL
jgi:hypothetical protein